jgi:simple sugar transport system permease protein
MSEKKDHNLNSPSKFNDEMKTIMRDRRPTELERAQMSPLRAMIADYGVPRMIITGFLLLLFIMTPFVGVNLPMQITNIINRFSWNAVLVLAMVPMIHSGCGLNFGLPLGVIAGLLGGTMSIQFGFERFGVTVSFLMAMVIATPFAVLFGLGYGWLLNKIKGGEMMIATYVGLSIVSFMCMMWLLLPYNSPTMVYGLSANGLRPTISLDGFYNQALAKLLEIDFAKIAQALHISLGPLEYIKIPTGSLLVFALLALAMWAFLHTKTGTAMTAVGSNPNFARAAGINVDRIRTLSVVMSTWLGAVGILMYQQGFGFIQLYTGPNNLTLPTVSAILIGGALVNKATIGNVIIGTILFQGMVTMTPTVMNAMVHMDMSEVIRSIVSNGMILYALTRKQEGTK